MSTTELSVRSALPALPVQTHPIVGSGLVETDLMLRGHYESAEQAMLDWLDHHRPEQAVYRACFWMRPKPDDDSQAVVLFIPDFGPCKHWPVGVTKNDPLAARLLLANSRAGWWLPGIRWELYGDPLMEDLIDMGSFHQWGLLGDISEQQLQVLASHGIKPSGNWDFQNLLWRNNCPSCGNTVAVNDHLFNIDSATCANCGNRPFLSRAIHRQLEDLRTIGDSEFQQRFSQHALEWLAGVRARFDQARRDQHDAGGKLLQGEVWQHCLVAKAADPSTSDQIRGLIEQQGINFEMYRVGCQILRDALLGVIPFREEHQITTQFVLDSTRLVQQRLLTTTSRPN